MIQQIEQASATNAIMDRFRVALQKNPRCVVCDLPVESPEGALLLERNDRLAHPGVCTAEALRHVFVYAHASRKGLRAMRRTA